ncbi:MAG: hypothetical protein IKZ82_07845 [Clostridia bacterium]|nr:hypothetical protein [Clostridia bacterium]
MKLKASDFISKIVCALVACCFLWVAAWLFSGGYYEYSPLYLSVGTLAALAVTVLFWRLIGRREAFFKKYSRFITAGFLVFMLAAQIAFSFPLRYTPAYDIDALFGGASEWVNTGSFPTYYEYFAMFHNNFGGLVLFRVWFALVKLSGTTDFFFAACLLNSLLSLATIALTASSAERLFGIRGRMTALFLFFISLPFYFIAPAFYTDALTMVFPALIFRAWLLARDKENRLQKLACFVLMGFACAIGCGIKATVVIMLIAVVIEGMLYSDWKTRLPLAAIAAALTLVVMLAVTAVIHHHIGEEQARKKRMPLTHWIMMGLANWGGYNGADYEFTKSFEDPDERAEAVAERIKERVNALGVGGLFKLWGNKLDLVWNDGTYGLSDCLGCPHEQDNFLHSFLLKNDNVQREVYKHLCTAVLAAMYLLLIASCVSDAFFKGTTLRILAPRLALLGVFVFFLLWEARWRYFSNFVPVIMLCALTGLESVHANLAAKKARNSEKTEEGAPLGGEGETEPVAPTAD